MPNSAKMIGDEASVGRAGQHDKGAIGDITAIEPEIVGAGQVLCGDLVPIVVCTGVAEVERVHNLFGGEFCRQVFRDADENAGHFP